MVYNVENLEYRTYHSTYNRCNDIHLKYQDENGDTHRVDIHVTANMCSVQHRIFFTAQFRTDHVTRYNTPILTDVLRDLNESKFS